MLVVAGMSSMLTDMIVLTQVMVMAVMMIFVTRRAASAKTSNLRYSQRFFSCQLD